MLLVIVGLSVLAAAIQSVPVSHPETMGGAFQGDIILYPNFNKKPSVRGAAIFGADSRWPSNTVPYNLSRIPDTNHRRIIVEAMNKLMDTVAIKKSATGSKRLCVFFRPAQPTDKVQLNVQYGSGCSASVGYNSYYENRLNLSPDGCFYEGVIQHELLHNLGFFHEQSRADRDSYVNVKLENVHEGMEHNFDKYEWGQMLEDLGFPYDYKSIMHYGNNYFSKNGQPTIVPKDSSAVIGNRNGLSEIDIAEVQKYYGCDKY